MRSSYYYALAHPKQPTRPELWEKVAEVFSRAPNGCGHRQIAMCLRAELGAAVADKTVLKIMGEMGIRCGIRRETDRRRYSSYKGVVGETFENVLARDFAADGPWQKMPDGAHPILHSDMGWQYQHAGWVARLKDAGIVQSMSRKGNCIDDDATEQVFGHLKDEFFRGREWASFEEFKRDLDEYVVYWNTMRRQVKLKGLTEEFQPVLAA
ncbi:MAG: IS3 family transposase [Eggerthellaceae bacterium]